MKLPVALAISAIMAVAPNIAMAAKVVFVNQSSWEIHEIYFSPASARNWGEDYLGNDILSKGDSLTLTGVEPGAWDVRLIDEDGDQCVLEDVELDGSDKWVIRDDDLLNCQANS